MVVSEIRSLYRDANDLFREVLKRIYEEWDADREQWHLKKIEFVYEDPELPVPSENPAVAVERRHGWLVPPDRRGYCYSGVDCLNRGFTRIFRKLPHPSIQPTFIFSPIPP